jgi:chromosomal replication initiator protein
MTNEELWRAALGEIELSISKANFITWFKNTSILSNEDGKVVIGVPNGFAKEWLENKYNVYILRALKNNQSDIKQVSCSIISSRDPFKKEIRVDAVSARNIAAKKKSQEEIKMAKIREETNLNPLYTFENFIVGSSNELAKAACYAVSQNLGKSYNPLFIYGGVGLGKTHLLQSIGNEVLIIDPNARVKYITSERFTSELIDSIKNQKADNFKQYYQQIDLLIIDDIQFLSGKEKTQEEFFHIFNHLYQLNRQIVLSSDRAPKAIPTLEERLRSRFEGGMIADVQSPDYETRLAILRKKAADKDLEITDEAIEYIAKNITSNIRELEGALNRIAASSQLSNNELNLEYVSEVLSELIASGRRKGVNHKHIIQVVSEFYEIKQDDLIMKNRKREVVKPRQVAMFLMRSELQYSYPGIGERLGGRDHTTAIHAYDKISKSIEKDDKLAEEIEYIRERLYKVC